MDFRVACTAIKDFRKWRNPLGCPWRCSAACLSLLRLCCVISGYMCLFLQVPSRQPGHTCDVQRETEQTREERMEPGTKWPGQNRKPSSDIWSSSGKKQNSPCRVNVCECRAEGTSEVTVALCVLQIILWFPQSSFRVIAIKHHLSPSQLGPQRVMFRDISALRKNVSLFEKIIQEINRDNSHSQIHCCSFTLGLSCTEQLEISRENISQIIESV